MVTASAYRHYVASSGTPPAQAVLAVRAATYYLVSGAATLYQFDPALSGAIIGAATMIASPPDTQWYADASGIYASPGHFSLPAATINVEQEFDTLAQEWHAETAHLSAPRQITLNPAYLRIIAMGDIAVPFILKDLDLHGGEWYAALRAITGASPVTPAMSQSSAAVRNAWLQWGRDHGYINWLTAP